jgi:hypothetical protein
MILDWTNWTFWLITLSLVAFGSCLRYIYEQWYFRKVRKEVRDDVREVHDLTRRLQATTERLNKANADAEAARLRSLIIYAFSHITRSSEHLFGSNVSELAMSRTGDRLQGGWTAAPRNCYFRLL